MSIKYTQLKFLKIKFRQITISACTKNIDWNFILEPFYQKGLNNYSSKENKSLISTLVTEHGIENPDKIKRWIDQRKRKERKSKAIKSSVEDKYVEENLQIPLPLQVSPLKLEKWIHYLQSCPLDDKDWVLNGIQHGFSLDCNSTNLISAKRNLVSAFEQTDVVDKYLLKEVQYGTMSGPYNNLPYENAHINRFGVIPKSSGKWRLITDLSYPLGGSVNDGVTFENYNVSYVGVSAAVEKILNLGRGCLLGKFDLKRAYRLLAIKEHERPLLVMKWKDKYYVDLALPFGARSAPRIFTRFADVLEWILGTHGNIENLQHSLDDFFVCGPPNTSICMDALERSFAICDDLGIAIEHSKTEGPATKITFLGLDIDTEAMEIRIPDNKLEKIRALLEEWYHKRTGTKRSLLSLIGSLYYCCQAVVYGRPFLTRLVKRAYSVEQLHHKVVLTRSECEDITWWFYLLNCWNGRSLLSDFSHSKTTMKLHS